MLGIPVSKIIARPYFRLVLDPVDGLRPCRLLLYNEKPPIDIVALPLKPSARKVFALLSLTLGMVEKIIMSKLNNK